MPRRDKQKKQAPAKPDPNALVDVKLRGGAKARASQRAVLTIMRDNGFLTTEQEGYGQTFAEDWMSMSLAGSSSSEVGEYVDKSKSSDASMVAAIDAAARVRAVRDRLSDPQFNTLVWCACLDLTVQKLAAKARVEPPYAKALLETALDTVVHVYAHRWPRPSRRVKALEPVIAEAMNSRRAG